jgi:hypothetical protein
MTTTSERGHDDEAADHLDDIDDGCGCAEVWEHLSEQREAESDAESESDTGSGT